MLQKTIQSFSVFFMTILFGASALAASPPVPFINPLGDMSAYSSVDISRNSSLELEIPVKDAILMKEVSGDVWYMNQDGDPEASRQLLKIYIESIGATILQWEPSKAIFKKDTGNGEVWWCRARLEGGLTGRDQDIAYRSRQAGILCHGRGTAGRSEFLYCQSGWKISYIDTQRAKRW